MQTLPKIIGEVQAVRLLSMRQIQRHLKAAGIAPVGARQRPQQWPDDAARRLLKYLGLNDAAAALGLPRFTSKPARVLTLKEIKRQAKKGGAK